MPVRGSRFTGKVAIVTGSSNGIGRAAAKLFASEGAKVVLTGRDLEALKAARQELISVGALPDEILEVDGNIGDESTQDRIIEETIKKFGRLDILAWQLPYYAMSKAALDMLTVTLGGALAPKGVRVNSVNPGYVRTTILEKQGIKGAALDQADATHVARILLGRSGKPEEMAEAIAFFADEKTSGFAVGACLLVDGGDTINRDAQVNYQQLGSKH